MIEMKISELILFLKEKKIDLEDFKVSYLIPMIRYEDKKEVVESFELKFENKQKYEEEE
jgi:hypothetical protein